MLHNQIVVWRVYQTHLACLPALTHMGIHIHIHKRTHSTLSNNNLHVRFLAFFDVIVHEYHLHNVQVIAANFDTIIGSPSSLHKMLTYIHTCLHGGNICFCSTHNGFTTIGLVVPVKYLRLLQPYNAPIQQKISFLSIYVSTR